MKPHNEIDPELLEKLTRLQSVPERSKPKEMAGLAAFLQESKDLSMTVTPHQKPRHNQWMYTLQSIFKAPQKEHSTMFSTIATILLITTLVFGGGATTIAAAQASQPNEPLYSLKVLSEDVRLGLSAEPKAEYQLALEFANRRAAEIQTQLESGIVPSAALRLRYQDQIEQSVRMALSLPADQAQQALGEIQARLQAQEQTFLQLQANGTAQAVLLQLQSMLQKHLQWVELGQNDPSQLRDQLRQLDQQRDQLHQMTATPPADQTWTPQGTPIPGSKIGPDGCELCTTTPDGSGPQHPNPYPGPQPTNPEPGPQQPNPYPGPQPTNAGPGPQPTNPGPGPQPTNPGPGPQPTNPGPGPQPTNPGPQPTQVTQPTSSGPIPQQTPPPPPQGGPGGPGGKR